MTTTFHDAHLDTLVKLKALVEKHGMKIRFGTYNSPSNDVDASVLEKFGIDGKFIELLDEYKDELVVDRIDTSTENIWFELYEPRTQEKTGYYSVMTYEKNEVHFTLENDWDGVIDGLIDDIKCDYTTYASAALGIEEDELDEEGVIKINELEKFREWLQKKSSEYGYFISFSNSPTKIRGFGKEGERDGRCYRDGMALHFFTELVCEYLKEPMINNTY